MTPRFLHRLSPLEHFCVHDQEKSINLIIIKKFENDFLETEIKEENFFFFLPDWRYRH
jgi:hypothetical protein